MIKRWKATIVEDNPLLAYLTHKRLVPYACIEPWLAYILGMISLLTAVMAILSIEHRIIEPEAADWWRFGLVVMWPAAVLPLVALVVAWALTIRTIRSDAYHDVLASPLQNRAISWGIIGAAAYWLRGWLTWLFGYTLIYIGAAAYAHQYFGQSLATGVLYGVAQSVGTWALFGAAVVLGVVGGLRRGWWPLIGILFMAGLVTTLIAVQLLLLLSAVALIKMGLDGRVLLVLGVGLPLLLLTGGMMVAARWVRLR